MYNLTSDVGLVSFEHVLEDCEKNGKEALIVASGGLDSAYTLWRYSRIKEKIHVHHFNMYNSKRMEAEELALENQIKFIGKDIELDKTSISTTFKDSLAPDWYLTAILSAEIALNKKISYIVIGDDLIDSYDRDQSYSVLPANKKNIIETLGNFIRHYSRNKLELCTASETNRLSEAYNEMPLEFTKLTFSCRTPESSEYFYRACGYCNSCMKNKHFGWWDKIGKEIRNRKDANKR